MRPRNSVSPLVDRDQEIKDPNSSLKNAPDGFVAE